MYGYGLDLKSSMGSCLKLVTWHFKFYLLIHVHESYSVVWRPEDNLQEPVSATDLWVKLWLSGWAVSTSAPEHSRGPLMLPSCSPWLVVLFWEAVGSLGSRGLTPWWEFTNRARVWKVTAWLLLHVWSDTASVGLITCSQCSQCQDCSTPGGLLCHISLIIPVCILITIIYK